MNVTGIIAEYNPFHSGHAYHLKRTRELTRADFCMVVMGGNFMQRGEPAIVDKYTRAKMALLGGADLVVELPTAFATGSAEYFAEGAVELLDGSGVVNALCFGSEEGDLPLLHQAADVLLTEPESYREALRANLRAGQSFPAAREKALEAALSLSPEKHASLLASPNNILGIEYLKALKKRGSQIQPYTIPRVGNYHGTAAEADEGFASASAIREELLCLQNCINCLQPNEGVPEQSSIYTLLPTLRQQLPESSYRLLLENFPMTVPSKTLEDFALPLHYRLLAAREPLEFSRYLDVSEDLSRRIFSLRHEFSGYEAFLDLVKTRQYTRTRIARGLLHILLDIRPENVMLPTHLRVLGFRREASPLLSELKQKSRLPLVTKAAGHDELAVELAASTLYHLGKPYAEQQKQLVIIP